MFYTILADFIVLLHFLFILFVLFGGFLLFWSRRAIWVHLPAALWAAFIEFSGWICPLTPLENILRQRGGAPAYTTGFIDHYIMPMLYPSFLTRKMQFVFGAVVIVVNAIVYWMAFNKKNRKTSNPTQ